jgi:hypothetical protein
MGAVLGIAFFGGLIWAVVAYGNWLRRGVAARTIRTTLDPEHVRDLFASSVCTGGWRVVDDGNPVVAQSSLATGARQQLSMEVTATADGAYEASIWPNRLMVRTLSRVPTKAHTLRMRMNRFVQAVSAADPGSGASSVVLPASVGDAPVAASLGAASSPAAWSAPVASEVVWIEPGWYPDPLDVGMLRYWDGTAWTERQGPVAS